MYNNYNTTKSVLYKPELLRIMRRSLAVLHGSRKGESYNLSKATHFIQVFFWSFLHVVQFKSALEMGKNNLLKEFLEQYTIPAGRYGANSKERNSKPSSFIGGNEWIKIGF